MSLAYQGTFLASDFHLDGDLVVMGDGVVHGKITGSLSCRGQIAQASVERAAYIGGDVSATKCELRGVVAGNVFSRICVVDQGGSLLGQCLAESVEGLSTHKPALWQYDVDDQAIYDDVFDLYISPILGEHSIGRSVIFSDERDTPPRNSFEAIASNLKRFFNFKK